MRTTSALQTLPSTTTIFFEEDPMNAIAVTGYFATGSGAVYNLLQEYRSVDDGGMSDFEHIFLYDVNGVFETIDRILYANSLYNSNAAINAFRREMQRLNDTDFGWFGGYRYRCGDRFMEIIEDFIDEITEYRFDRDWYNTFLCRKHTPERLLKDSVKVLLGRLKPDRNFGTTIMMDPNNRGEYSFASPQKLQAASRKLITRYIETLYPMHTEKTVILNHLIQPQYAHRLHGYTPDGLKLIIVDRDIRDLYVYNKYTNVWGGNTFPTELEDFIRFTKAYRATEQKVASDRILRVQFEDLIYDYDNTVSRIETFVGLHPEDHTTQGTKLVPQRSIKNTQVFTIREEWNAELKRLEEEFPDMIYNFPYKNTTSMAELFGD